VQTGNRKPEKPLRRRRRSVGVCIYSPRVVISKYNTTITEARVLCNVHLLINAEKKVDRGYHKILYILSIHNLNITRILYIIG